MRSLAPPLLAERVDPPYSLADDLFSELVLLLPFRLLERRVKEGLRTVRAGSCCFGTVETLSAGGGASGGEKVIPGEVSSRAARASGALEGPSVTASSAGATGECPWGCALG